AHGGGWSPDGKTLPGVLDIEYDPYTSNICYGVSQANMVAWIRAFNNEYVAKTGVYPIIYSTVGWWKTCTGDSSAFANTNPFWIADPNTGSTTSGPGSLPAGTGTWTFWQYGKDGNIDWNKFNGGTSQLSAIATTYAVDPHVASAWTSSMGYPTGRVSKVTAFGVTGYIQRFPNGRALINSKYGTFSSSGATLTSWTPAKHGWPTTNLTAVTGHGTSGYQQRFAEGTVTNARSFVSPLHPAAIWVNGGILSRYDALGGTRVLGWPIASMTSTTAFNVKGYIQKFQSSRALIGSTYGVFASNGAIFGSWSPSVRGWPTADLKTATYRGRAGWLQTFRKGSSGRDFGFIARTGGGVLWVNGTP
ncbi:MAG: GH25 family lysozyme, partial [Marmoricola sp.]